MTTPHPAPAQTARQIPSIIWILLFVLGVVGFIGAIIFFFYALGTIEGVGSAVMLIAALAVIWPTAADASHPPAAGDSFFRAAGISFFALMGMAVDQTGNLLYNYPVQVLFCPVGSTLSRGVDITNPLPGRTDIIQAFTCLGSDGAALLAIHPLQVMVVRFFEYVFIGYLLLWVVTFVKNMRQRQQAHA